jgi:hypothetical protein
LVELFQKLRILDIANGDPKILKLLRVYNIAELAILLEKTSDIFDKATLEMYVFVISEFVSALLKFKRSVSTVSTIEDGSLTTKNFILDLNTGIMTNPLDHSRNVSFKAITFSTMLGDICSQVVASFIPNKDAIGKPQDRKLMEQKMGKILLSSGYSVGSKFGEALSEKLNQETPPMSIHDKIKTWCQFDTIVGWGKFEDDLIVDETRFAVSGRVILKSNFLITDRIPEDFNLCGLMGGYISGVLEKLLGFKVDVKHNTNSNDCGLFAGKDSCDFFVSKHLQQGKL